MVHVYRHYPLSVTVFFALGASCAFGISIGHGRYRSSGVPTCKRQSEELRISGGVYVGECRIGANENRNLVCLPDTGSADITSNHYGNGGPSFSEDGTDTVQYYNGPVFSVKNVFDSFTMGSCTFESKVRVMNGDNLSSRGFFEAVVGLGPHVNHSTEHYGGGTHRVSFCIPDRPERNAVMSWDLAENAGNHVQALNVYGGLKAHHWGIQVTGLSFFSKLPDGSTVRTLVGDKLRQEALRDPKAYWVAIADTGTGFLMAPQDVIGEISSYMNTHKLFDCASKSLSALPELEIKLDSQQAFLVRPQDYLRTLKSLEHLTDEEFAQVRDNLSLPPNITSLADLKVSNLHTQCYANFVTTPYNGVFVMGVPFMRGRTMHFDYQSRQVIIEENQGTPCVPDKSADVGKFSEGASATVADYSQMHAPVDVELLMRSVRAWKKSPRV